MENYHKPVKSKSSGTGGKCKKSGDKKRCHVGGPFTASRVSEKGKEIRKITNTRGTGFKLKLKTAKSINVLNKEGKIVSTTIVRVMETPANRHYARKNYLIKGAIVQTELGNAVVTNRVGQDGVVNGKLV